MPTSKERPHHEPRMAHFLDLALPCASRLDHLDPCRHLGRPHRDRRRRGRGEHHRAHSHRMGELPRGLWGDPSHLPCRTEIGRSVVRRHFWSSKSIGVVGFFAPYLGVHVYGRYGLGWGWPQAQIAGIALSTTSVAVVYAVMIETGFNNTEIGKIILAACFINDLGTVLALGVVFARYDLRLAGFGALTALALWLLPRFSPWFFGKVGHRSASQRPNLSHSSSSASAVSPRSPATKRCCRPTSSAWRSRRPFSLTRDCRSACGSSPSLS